MVKFHLVLLLLMYLWQLTLGGKKTQAKLIPANCPTQWGAAGDSIPAAGPYRRCPCGKSTRLTHLAQMLLFVTIFKHQHQHVFQLLLAKVQPHTHRARVLKWNDSNASLFVLWIWKRPTGYQQFLLFYCLVCARLPHVQSSKTNTALVHIGGLLTYYCKSNCAEQWGGRLCGAQPESSSWLIPDKIGVRGRAWLTGDDSFKLKMKYHTNKRQCGEALGWWEMGGIPQWQRWNY